MSLEQYGRDFPILLQLPSPRNKIVLLETIGKGNYGSVYKATLHSAVVAVKVVFLKEDEVKETLLEMEILERCSHVGVTEFKGAFLKGLDLWICMEFCGGGSVDSVYRTLKKQMPEEAIAAILFESLEALEYLHTQAALIHRDIKAGNLLLTLDGRVKLADFGVSAQLATIGGKANTFIGTPYWMAPEVIACDPDSKISSQVSYTDKSDVWSLGITAIEMAEKNPPLSDIHPMQALKMIANSDVTFAKPKVLPKALVDFVTFLLVKDPRMRPGASACLRHPYMTYASKLDRPVILADLVRRVLAIKESKKLGTAIPSEEEDVKVTSNTLRPSKTLIISKPVVVDAPLNNFPAIVSNLSKSTTLPILDPIALTCLESEICTADFLDKQYILIGTERGLFYLDILKPLKKTPIPLIHDIRFKQIQILAEYSVLIALSGRHDHIRQYTLTGIRKLILYVEGGGAKEINSCNTTVPLQDINLEALKAVEIENEEENQRLISIWTNDFIKIPGTKDTKSFLVEETETTAYISILLFQGITLFRWAVAPYEKFMKIKSFWVPETPQFISFAQDGVSAVDLYVGYNSELNSVNINDSNVKELGIHKEMKIRGMVKPRWQSISQIPLTDAKLEEILRLSNKDTTGRRVAGMSTLVRSQAGERYFLGTYDRLTKVVDSKAQPMMGQGVGGWKDGVMWSEPPIAQILRSLQHVISIGKNSIEIVEWKEARLCQRLSIESGYSFKIVASKCGFMLIAVEKKKKGYVLYWMKESSNMPRKAGEIMKRINMEIQQESQDRLEEQMSQISISLPENPPLSPMNFTIPSPISPSPPAVPRKELQSDVPLPPWGGHGQDEYHRQREQRQPNRYEDHRSFNRRYNRENTQYGYERPYNEEQSYRLPIYSNERARPLSAVQFRPQPPNGHMKRDPRHYVKGPREFPFPSPEPKKD